MAISLASLRRGAIYDPPTLLIYGPAGIGKTTLAAGAPSPVLMPLEDGRGMLETPAFPLLTTFQEVIEAIGSLVTEDHEFRTLIVDSLDWLERIVHAVTCEQNGWDNIDVPDYGKGYGAAMTNWKYLLDGFAAVRQQKQMAIIFLAHASIINFKSPEVAPFDRYRPKLHESAKGAGANPLLQEHVDCILFNNWRTSVVNDKTSNNKKDVGHNRGMGGGSRIIYTQERPAFLAKNRYNMPPEITLPNDPAAAFGMIAQYLPYYTQNNAQAA